MGTFPVHGEVEVRAAVERARTAAEWWSGLSFKDRKVYLTTWKAAITRRMPELAELMHRETGKPRSDAMLEACRAVADALTCTTPATDGVDLQSGPCHELFIEP